MGDWKPLIIGMIIIFIVGGLLSVMLSPFVNVEQETQDSWINPFVSATGFMFDLVSTAIILPVGFFEGIFDFFSGGIDDTEAFNIQVTGTGEHNGHSLDGRYIYYATDRLGREEVEGSGSLPSFPDTLLFERDEEDNVIGAVLRSTKHTFWFFTYETIYNSTESANPDIIDFELIKTDYDYSLTAEGLINVNEELIEDMQTLVYQIRVFMNEAKEQTQESMQVLGIIPNVIGIPLIIVLLLGFFYSIIKLLPWT